MTGARFTVVSPPSQSTGSDDDPHRTMASFWRALVAGDSEGATACFARGASLLTPDGTEVSGRRGIHTILAQMAASGPQINFGHPSLIVVADVALCSQRWTVRLNQGRDGFEQSAVLTAALRCASGCWELLIVAPWGSRA